MKITVNKETIYLSDSLLNRIEAVMDDYSVSPEQFVEEAIRSRLKYYEELTEMFRANEGDSNG